MALSDYFTAESITSIRSRVIGYARAAGLAITDWIVGAVGQQELEVFTAIEYAKSETEAKLVRGFASLDTSTDPGDFDQYDPGNADLPPARGLLSAFGENTFSTVRGEDTFAEGHATFVNASGTSQTIEPGGLVFTWTENGAPSPAPTYHNSPDAAVYTNTDGTLTIPNGGSAVLPVLCDIQGTAGSCPSGSLSLTTTIVGCTATNASAVVGNDREDADVYRGKCRQMPARLSLGGPADAYRYLASKNLDGTPLYNKAAVPAPVAITRVAVSEDSATGIVDVFYATDAGAPSADDVTAANENIEINTMACPDVITFTGTGALELSLAVGGKVWLRAKPGLDIAAVKQAISAKIAKYQPQIPIGGFPLTSGGPGWVVRDDLEREASSAWPGIYAILVMLPPDVLTMMGTNQVAVLVSPPTYWEVEVVP